MVLEINEEIYLYTFAGEDNFGSEKQTGERKERLIFLTLIHLPYARAELTKQGRRKGQLLFHR